MYVARLELQNKGTVPLDCNWQVIMDDFLQRPGSQRAETPRPATAGPLIINSSDDIRPSTSGSSRLSDAPYVPFLIVPESCTVQPGKSTKLTVKFSPLDVGEFEGRLICRSVKKRTPVVASAYFLMDLSLSNRLTLAQFKNNIACLHGKQYLEPRAKPAWSSSRAEGTQPHAVLSLRAGRLGLHPERSPQPGADWAQRVAAGDGARPEHPRHRIPVHGRRRADDQEVYDHKPNKPELHVRMGQRGCDRWNKEGRRIRLPHTERNDYERKANSGACLNLELILVQPKVHIFVT